MSLPRGMLVSIGFATCAQGQVVAAMGGLWALWAATFIGTLLFAYRLAWLLRTAPE